MINSDNWPANKVKRYLVAELMPYAQNARTHSDAQIDQIAASIREWGWTNPVLVDEVGGIIAGHGRVLAAQKLNIPQVPVMIASGWTEAQKRAYIIADNQLALNAGWELNMLKLEMGELAELDFDIDLIGFDADFLATLLNDPDFAPGSEDDQGKLDELAPKMVTCPHCQAEWDLREHGQG